MPDSRKARRERDPGLQPERTSIAWLRTLLGYGALLVLAVKHNGQQAGSAFWIAIALLMSIGLILWRYTLKRNLMDVDRSDFLRPSAVRDKLLVALGVLSLALLFAATHLQQIALFLLAALHAS